MAPLAILLCHWGSLCLSTLLPLPPPPKHCWDLTLLMTQVKESLEMELKVEGHRPSCVAQLRRRIENRAGGCISPGESSA